MNVDAVLLRHFLRIYECGGIGRAAVDLGLSQPALSKSLRRLEDVLGVQLFLRSTSGISATEFAHVLARQARLVETELRNAVIAVRELRDATRGHAVLGASPAVAAALLPRVSVEMARVRPNLRLTVQIGMSEALVEDVRSGKLEFAVCTGPVAPGEGLVAEPVFRDRLVVLAGAGHSLAAQRSVSIRAMADCAWILSPWSEVVRNFFDGRFKAAGVVPPVPRIESMSLDHIREAILSNLYLSFIPRGPMDQEIAAGAMRVLRPNDFQLVRTVVIIYRASRRLSPGGMAVVESMRAAARAHSQVDVLAPPSLDMP